MSDVSDDIIARIEALEQAVQQPLDLSQLPLGDLQRQLENNWQPDATMLQPHSITSDQLSSGLLSPPVVTSLPPSPSDGDNCFYLADAVNGVVWNLKYRAGEPSAHKWECVGGPALHAVESSSWSGVSSTSFATDANGPQVTVPLAGDYDVSFSCAYADNSVAGHDVLYVPAVSAAAAAASNAIAIDTRCASGSVGTGAGASMRLTNVAAGQVIQMYARISIAGDAGRVFGRTLNVTPVRVG